MQIAALPGNAVSNLGEIPWSPAQFVAPQPLASLSLLQVEGGKLRAEAHQYPPRRLFMLEVIRPFSEPELALVLTFQDTQHYYTLLLLESRSLL